MQPMLLLLRSHCCKRLLYVLILSLTSTYAHAYTGAQNDHPVTLNGTNITLRTVFKAIKQQTGFAVMYSTAATALNQDEKVSVHFKDTPLDDVLAYLLRGKELDWKYSDDVLVIHKKETTVPEKKMEADSTVIPAMVTGKVTDANGNPLIGATVLVKGANQGATTDAEGNFALPKVKNGSTLMISSIGYAKREVTVSGNRILTQLNVDINKLDETVIIAYGETTRRLSTGNISSVKAKDIEKSPVSNPLLALQGRVPGLFIEQATGIPGSGVTVRIQGQNSLQRGSDPLYVIDGVPYISQNLYALSPIQGRSGSDGGGSPLSYINPADIESIDVLKDADATSIYGSRAAAGAILITTKRGKAGKTKVDLNLQQGWSKVGHFLKLLNTPQYLEMRHEAKANDGAAIRATDYDLNGTWDTARYTDWQKTLIGGTAHYTDAQLSISGGTANTTFLAGGGYHRESTVFPGDLHDQKSSVHLNVNHNSSNNRFRFQINGQYLVDNNQLINSDLTGSAVGLVPNAPALYDTYGSLNWAPNASGTSTWNNPLANLLASYNSRVNNLIGNSIISYEPYAGLVIKANLGYTNLTKDEIVLNPLSYFRPEDRPFSSRASFWGTDKLSSWIIEPQLTYRKQLLKGTLDALLGSTFLQNSSNQQQLAATGFSSDLLLKNIVAATSVVPFTVVAAEYKYNALFARLSYNWKDKYIVNLNARRDGSSRFGANNLFHNFGSIGAAWIFSNEKFAQQYFSLLSFGKLRASYGTSGNDQIGDYQFMNLYRSRNRAAPYQNITGLYTSQFPNPYLQWEETRKLQAGLDIGILADRILFNLTYYKNTSSNQLQPYALPIITGSTGIVTNFPAKLQNSGWELSLNTDNIIGNNLKWSTSINLTIPKNKLVAYENLEQSSYATQYIIGKPFTIFKYYAFMGVDPTTGQYIVADSKGNPTYTPDYTTDANYLLNTSPQYYGGIQNNISYKSFSLDFLFQFVKQEAVDYIFGNLPGRFSNGTGNQPISILARWQKPGDTSPIQRFSANNPFNIRTSYYNAIQSNATLNDASYIRLKNISLSWNIPNSILRSAHLQYARFYIQGQNFLTFTKYKGFDPESKNTTSLPPLRTYTLGVQITL